MICISGYVSYSVSSFSNNSQPIKPECHIRVIDKGGKAVASKVGCSDVITIKNPKFWWPNGMHPEYGYMYQLHVRDFLIYLTQILL